MLTSFPLFRVAAFLAPQILFSFTALADARVPARGPALVDLPISKIYVPQGFDDNDNVEVIVHGTLPNSCMRVNAVSAVLDAVQKTVVVTGTALRYQGPCIQMLVPYALSAHFGLTPSGDYRVSAPKAPGVPAVALHVDRARSINADDYLYAPVDSVDLVRTGAAGKLRLSLEGRFPYMFVGCMELDHVETHVAGEVIVVQPIARIMQEDCSTAAPGNRFRTSLVVKTALTRDALVHVRTLNGQSLNRHFETIEDER